MITVRFPNGVAVRYPKAGYIFWGTQHHSLYTSKDQTVFVASVPKECAIEFYEGTVVTALIIGDELDRMSRNTHELRWLNYGTIKRLKQAFKHFDIRSGRWTNK